MVTSNTTTYGWDYENRLTSVTLPSGGGTVTFKYDPFGRRIYKSLSSAGTSVFAYDGDNLIEETNSTGTAVARYEQTQNIDEPLAMLRSSTTSYYQADGLGSVTSLSNGTGALAQTYTFDSFGKQTASSGSLVNSFQYTGRELDSDTGLYYYRARYYDPATGRFMGEDPWRFYSDVNFYPYVDNDPTVLIDPYGLYTRIGKAVCHFTPDMNRALLLLDICLKHDVTITCGNDRHGPNDPHMKGLAVDIGHVSNPWLSREQIEKCFYFAFPSTSYAQEEYNDDTNDPKKRITIFSIRQAPEDLVFHQGSTRTATNSMWRPE